MRVGILTSHPIQYQAPLFSELARRVVYNFERYDMDIPSFREKRREVLKALSTD